MNNAEVYDALCAVVQKEFDKDEFPWEFLRAVGEKETSIRRLQAGDTNYSDIGGVLLRNRIHLKVCALGETLATLNALKDSPVTERRKARFVLATDGEFFEFEDIFTGDIASDSFANLIDHIGILLPVAGIESVAVEKESTVDIKATNQLNRLYLELRAANPDWSTVDGARRMNHFLARLIFCFFAEDTQILHTSAQFTEAIALYTQSSAEDVHTTLETIFRAMNMESKSARAEAGLPGWAQLFPYVNGGLFAGDTQVPRFTRMARNYLVRIGGLNWTQINPDIFGSMIQTIADPEERQQTGTHYTSVSNILKVINPLFLDDLRAHLEEAGENRRKLANLRTRLSKIRVFDPACGSGNFLVIAYKELRAIEAEIDRRRGEEGATTGISLLNFRGIEISDFAAEIARIALVIAKYKADVLHCGQQNALDGLLPLSRENWIIHGNALRLDWREVCPPSGREAAVVDTEADLFAPPLAQPHIGFENEGGETYICGNPPYLGSTNQSAEQKADMKVVFEDRVKNFASLDYVAAWFMKAAEYRDADIAFVSTNSVNQGELVSRLWPPIFANGFRVHFAYTSFKWENLAAYNAGVTVAIIGLTRAPGRRAKLYVHGEKGEVATQECANINAYLVNGPDVYVAGQRQPMSQLTAMVKGNQPTDGGHLLLSGEEYRELTSLISEGGGGLYRPMPRTLGIASGVASTARASSSTA